MAKGSGESKLALVGVLTLAVALAGVLLVKEPLRSSRPVGTGLDVNQTTGEESVRARLWEDPVAAVQRGLRGTRPPPTGSSKPGQPVESSLSQRLRPLRQAIADRVKNNERITVLLVTLSGDPYAESTESPSEIAMRSAPHWAWPAMFRRMKDISPSLRGTLRALVMRCRTSGFGSARHEYAAKNRIESRAHSSSGFPTTP